MGKSSPLRRTPVFNHKVRFKNKEINRSKCNSNKKKNHLQNKPPSWNKNAWSIFIEWFALETNREHSVVFEIASKYCTLDSFVDHDGYSISSKGFLPTLVDIMVIWVKFTDSRPF